MTDDEFLKLPHIAVCNFDDSDHFEFIDKDFRIKFDNPLKFNELTQKLVMHLKNEITKKQLTIWNKYELLSAN